MAVKKYKIYQGDTGPIIRPRPNHLAENEVLDVNWSCRMGANNQDGTVAIAKREVTDITEDGMRFIAAFTPTETDTIIAAGEDPTVVDMVVEVTNVTTIPPFNIEKHYTLEVYEQGVLL